MGQLRNDLSDRMRSIVLEGADFILVKERYLYDRIKNLKVPSQKPICLMRVDNLDDLRLISEDQMKAAGWVKNGT